MRTRPGLAARAAILLAFGAACAHAAGGGGEGATVQNRLSAEEIASARASTLYDAIQRLRPRWLEVRAPRGFVTETEIVVFMDRTLLGGVDELRRLGPEVAASLQYLPGAAAQAQLPGIGTRHVEGAIIVHTVGRRD